MVKLDLEDYISHKLVKTDDVVVLLTAGAVIPAGESQFGKEEFNVSVKLPDGRTKLWTMNKTTQRALSEAWGDETEQWINKKVKVKVTEQSVRGEMKQVVFGEAA